MALSAYNDESLVVDIDLCAYIDESLVVHIGVFLLIH